MFARDSLSVRTQLFCVWCGPVGIGLYLIFFAGVARFVPPPSPAWTAAHVANYFAIHSTSIRIGQVGGLVSSMLLMPFFTVIAIHVADIEGRRPLLAMLQWAGGLILVIWFALCSMVWLLATFRTDLAPGTIRMLNDFAWLAFVMAFPQYVMQMIAIGVTALRDTSPDPIWPRWMGYLTLWEALSGAGGGLAVFFKHGPFAWDGLIGFWLPLGMFGIWLPITTWLLHSGIKRRAAVAVRQEGLVTAALTSAAQAG